MRTYLVAWSPRSSNHIVWCVAHFCCVLLSLDNLCSGSLAELLTLSLVVLFHSQELNNVNRKIKEQQNDDSDGERAIAVGNSLEPVDFANICEHVDHLENKSDHEVRPNAMFAELVLSRQMSPVRIIALRQQVQHAPGL